MSNKRCGGRNSGSRSWPAKRAYGSVCRGTIISNKSNNLLSSLILALYNLFISNSLLDIHDLDIREKPLIYGSIKDIGINTIDRDLYNYDTH